MSEEKVLGLNKSLGFPNGEVMVAAELSGSLVLFYRKVVVIALQSKLRSHIDVILSCDNLSSRQW